MKKIASLIVLMLIISSIYSQSFYRVPYYDWSSKTSFMVSPSPMITGYGFLSDSLSKAHPDTTFYEYNGEYYPITCWADYYLWYVNKYWYYFDEPGLYEYYYSIGDEYGMAQYICGANYHGYMYPARIAIMFPGREVYRNYYSVYRVKRRCKNDSWVNRNYIAVSEKDRPSVNVQKRDYKENNLNRPNRNNVAIVHSNRISKDKSDDKRYLTYTNGPSNFERINRDERLDYTNNPRNSNNFSGSTNRTSNNTRTNSNRINSNSSVGNSGTTNRTASGNARTNNSRQIHTNSSKRGR